MLLATLLIVSLMFGLGAILGAPYLPILRRDSTKLLDLAALKPGDTLIDLGSGDGRLLRSAAARGIKSIGYEINPMLVLISRIVCWRYRNLVTIHLADFWHATLPPADTIYVFLIERYMQKLDQKLAREIHQPTRVVSFVFELPGRKPIKQNTNTHVYEYGRQS